MDVRKLSVVLVLSVATAVIAAPRRRAVGISRPSEAWRAALTASATGHVTIAGKSIASSSRLALTWAAPRSAVDHFAVIATETAGGSPLPFTAANGAASMELTALESGTQYRIDIRACIDAACVSSIASSDATATASTSDEYWQVRGSGSSFSTADRIVSDGNTKAFAIRWEGVTTAADRRSSAWLCW